MAVSVRGSFGPVVTSLEGLAKEDEKLARSVAPVLRLDAREPFKPRLVGVTVARTTMESPSFDRILQPHIGESIIEYALWWDWDIYHLYELEHVWVHLDVTGAVATVEGSAHGSYRKLDVVTESGHPIVVCEPGKHAFCESGSALSLPPKTLALLCGAWAGCGGLIARDVVPGTDLLRFDPANRRLARNWLRLQAFEPTFEFSSVVQMSELPFVTWPSAAKWIPQRVEQLLLEVASGGVSPPLEAVSIASVEGLSSFGLRSMSKKLALVAEPEDVAVGSDEGRLSWLRQYVSAAHKAEVRIVLEMRELVSAGLLEGVGRVFDDLKRTQSSIVLVPFVTDVRRLKKGGDLALGYIANEKVKFDEAVLSRAVAAGVEFVRPCGGVASMSPAARRARLDHGVSWIVSIDEDLSDVPAERATIVVQPS